MRRLTLTIFITSIAFFAAIAQKKVERLDSYEASNGITYKVGDDIQLNRGSGMNGQFVYVTMGGWATVTATASDLRLPAQSSGLIVTIKKIKRYNMRRQRGVYFTVDGGNITNYWMNIEQAIASCEIKPCNE